MPPKQRITRELILEVAFTMTRTSGIATLNARDIAKKIGCSTQPIFSQFATMEELRQATFDYASQCWMNEIMQYKDQPDFVSQVNLWVIRLARNEPHSFHLLYLSDSYQKENLFDYMMGFESNKAMISNLAVLYQLSEDACKNIFLRGFLLLHGIATMIATNHIHFEDEEVLNMMKETVSAMVVAEKQKGQK